MDELRLLRAKIDSIDDILAALFKQRLELVAEIAQCKQKAGAAIFDPERETEILKRVTAHTDERLVYYMSLLFRTAFDIGQSYQSNLLAGPSRITGLLTSCLNSNLCLRERAAVVYFADKRSRAAKKTCEIFFKEPVISRAEGIAQALGMLSSGDCEYAVIAAEREQIYELLNIQKLFIVKEVVKDEKRIFCIGKKLCIASDANLLAARLELPDNREALYRLLARFAADCVRVLNLKLCGRVLYFDMEWSEERPGSMNLLSRIEKDYEKLSLLGIYSREER